MHVEYWISEEDDYAVLSPYTRKSLLYIEKDRSKTFLKEDMSTFSIIMQYHIQVSFAPQQVA